MDITVIYRVDFGEDQDLRGMVKALPHITMGMYESIDSIRKDIQKLPTSNFICVEFGANVFTCSRIDNADEMAVVLATLTRVADCIIHTASNSVEQRLISFAMNYKLEPLSMITIPGTVLTVCDTNVHSVLEEWGRYLEET